MIFIAVASFAWALNESPSEKEGKLPDITTHAQAVDPSMKVPPKRKGNRQRRNCKFQHDFPQ